MKKLKPRTGLGEQQMDERIRAIGKREREKFGDRVPPVTVRFDPTIIRRPK